MSLCLDCVITAAATAAVFVEKYLKFVSTDLKFGYEIFFSISKNFDYKLNLKKYANKIERENKNNNNRQFLLQYLKRQKDEKQLMIAFAYIVSR